MLVRFLSYAASVIGAKRYKPLLISCLALVFSITGIAIVASSLSSGSSDAASRVGQQNGAQPQNGQEQTSLGGLQQKSTKEEDAIQQQNSEPKTGGDDKQVGNTAPEPAALDITLNATMVSLSQASPQTALTVTATENKDLVWSVTPENTNGVSARIEPAKDNAGTAAIRFRAEAAAPGVYQFTVTVKNTLSSQSASKTLSVTVH